MYSFPSLEPVCCSMSGSNCCFLTCIQISQEAVRIVTILNTVCLSAESLQSCPTLYDAMDYSPPASSVQRDSPGKNSGVGCCVLLQGIFPTQIANPHLCVSCMQTDFSLLSHQGSPIVNNIVLHIVNLL